MGAETRTGGREATSAVIGGGLAIAVGKPTGPTPEGFRWVPLGELARLETGHTPSRKHPEYWDGDIPWIGIRDATSNHGRTITSTNQTVTQLGIENSSARILPAGTVCLSRTASVGYVVIMGKPMATSQDFVNWVCGPELDPVYLKYVLQVDRQALMRFANGSTHQTIYFPEVKAFHALLPSIAVQRSIAAILLALDDKIESNRRVCSLLGELSRAKFRLWRSRVGVSRSRTFGDFAEVFGGATPSTSNSDYWEGTLAWATPTDVTRLAEPYLFETSRTLSAEGLAACSAVLHPVGTILMTSRATIGAFAVNQVPTATNQGFIAVRPCRPEHRWFLYEEMRSRVQEFTDNANGSTFLEISRGRFKDLPLSVPEDSDIDALDQELSPLHRKAAQAASESRRLEVLRDALMPELLTGRIRLADVDDGDLHPGRLRSVERD